MAERFNMSDEKLNEALASEGQQAMRDLVAGLPEESPSMAWRSALNERLLSEAKVARRRRSWTLAWRPALALGAVGVLAFLALTPTSVAPASNLEGLLVREHYHEAQLADVTDGIGATAGATDAESLLPVDDLSSGDWDPL